MAFVVTSACIKCRHTDCVEVCPVDCFHLGENMLVINPDECIDCALCYAECPVEAIQDEYDVEGSEEHEFIELNATHSQSWPSIVEMRDSLPDAHDWGNVPNKRQYFSPNPG